MTDFNINPNGSVDAIVPLKLLLKWLATLHAKIQEIVVLKNYYDQNFVRKLWQKYLNME